ncbi:hypothetical protein [Sinorhizobium meliloti]|uniref:hypothetical protein n=1 Tax=Rhizobium meliloti TaxID=382 RepID=UPI000FDA15B7|nr:hypothetical protein [Sinorhizobium meliloti]RVG88715.1 hypothetical protein CN219_03860 [Sinorhizobium meliloti]RVI39003.1 hypothetical protein CN197_02375 [Sinorhizobium meliloti]RVI46639.1 hypothetical protein CN196_09225 [Sinorhizobium meliloti]RVJ25640.1 hypothetical protein CN177_13265 [Sinorhizobium meliloti]RVK02281.1 hypothetical protein CN170_08865 [Sinorhizobium meliloti]
MSDSKKIELFEAAYKRTPNVKVGTVFQRIRKAEKAEELRRPVQNPRGVVAMLRKLTGRA